eukprot:PRCOL_00003279-RA
MRWPRRCARLSRGLGGSSRRSTAPRSSLPSGGGRSTSSRARSRRPSAACNRL